MIEELKAKAQDVLNAAVRYIQVGIARGEAQEGYYAGIVLLYLSASDLTPNEFAGKRWIILAETATDNLSPEARADRDGLSARLDMIVNGGARNPMPPGINMVALTTMSMHGTPRMKLAMPEIFAGMVITELAPMIAQFRQALDN